MTRPPKAGLRSILWRDPRRRRGASAATFFGADTPRTSTAAAEGKGAERGTGATRSATREHGEEPPLAGASTLIGFRSDAGEPARREVTLDEVFAFLEKRRPPSTGNRLHDLVRELERQQAELDRLEAKYRALRAVQESRRE